jgi:hypothetical protein
MRWERVAAMVFTRAFRIVAALVFVGFTTSLVIRAVSGHAIYLIVEAVGVLVLAVGPFFWHRLKHNALSRR